MNYPFSALTPPQTERLDLLTAVIRRMFAHTQLGTYDADEVHDEIPALVGALHPTAPTAHTKAAHTLLTLLDQQADARPDIRDQRLYTAADVATRSTGNNLVALQALLDNPPFVEPLALTAKDVERLQQQMLVRVTAVGVPQALAEDEQLDAIREKFPGIGIVIGAKGAAILAEGHWASLGADFRAMLTALKPANWGPEINHTLTTTDTCPVLLGEPCRIRRRDGYLTSERQAADWTWSFIQRDPQLEIVAYRRKLAARVAGYLPEGTTFVRGLFDGIPVPPAPSPADG